MSEKTIINKNINLLGYILPVNPIVISLIGIFTALNFIATFFIQIYIPATGGYINIGDFAVMSTALLFGPIIGGICGGLGPMLADLFSGAYIIYAPATIIIKAFEGFIVGLIANPKKNDLRITFYDIIAVLIGGIFIPIGYFIYEAFILGLGIPTAFVEVPGNLFQFIFGVIGSVLLITASRKNIINGFPQVFDKIFILKTS